MRRDQRREPDRPVAAGDHDAIRCAVLAQDGARLLQAVVVEPAILGGQILDRGDAEVRAVCAQQRGEALRLGRRARLRIGDEGEAHQPILPRRGSRETP